MFYVIHKMFRARKVIMTLIACIIIFQLHSKMIFANEGEKVKETKLAIVIDDLGNNMEGSEKILNLPIPLTVAIMPFLPSTKADAELAHKNNKEVIVHLPMEAIRGKASWLGPGAILSGMSDSEVKQRVESAIADVPYAVGMNNHMGSKITSNKHLMRIILSVCKEHNLYFLDSKTVQNSVVAEVAEELGVPYIVNNIFLDDHYNEPHITKQMNYVLKTIEDRPRTVVIGHVGPPGKYTSTVIERAIPQLQQNTILVPLTTIIEDSIIDDKIM